MPQHDPQAVRSYAPLTPSHLKHLSALADADHARFTRDDGRPEYRGRRLLVTLAQGAAQHWVDRRHGVKDLDVWTFYAAIDGQPFPAARRETHADFGVSALGRQTYDLAVARNDPERARFLRWRQYEGRRVDFLIRALAVQSDVTVRQRVAALQDWLAAGAASTSVTKPSAWWLAQRPVVVIDPPRHRGRVI
jgi:hypothetical protein